MENRKLDEEIFEAAFNWKCKLRKYLQFLYIHLWKYRKNPKRLAYRSVISFEPISFFLSSVRESDVLEAVMKLENTCGLHYYCMNSKLIMSVLTYLLKLLTLLINQYFEEGNWLNLFMIVKVSPLFKKGDSTLPENYRPIVILPIRY